MNTAIRLLLVVVVGIFTFTFTCLDQSRGPDGCPAQSEESKFDRLIIGGPQPQATPPENTLHVIAMREAKMTERRPDRRNLTRRGAISAQLRAVLSSPSLLLTVDETQRLLRLHRDACQRILRRLLEAGVLREIQRGVYTPTTLISGLPTP
jgi:hypothetical protein